MLELPTLEARLDGATFVAVNDVVATSSTLGRMVELSWAVGAEDLGTVPCDGMICATPSGSTAYNLSNGGPVLMRGLDAMTVTFIAPHSLHARPLVLPRGAELSVRNTTADVGAAVLIDGHREADIPPDGRLAIRLGPERSLLATLPESTFFGRYRETFTALPDPVRNGRWTGSDGLQTRTGASPPAPRGPRPDPRGRAGARARPQRDHGGDGRRQDDPRPGGRAAARRERR